MDINNAPLKNHRLQDRQRARDLVFVRLFSPSHGKLDFGQNDSAGSRVNSL
jgi:hypothetical protein